LTTAEQIDPVLGSYTPDTLTPLAAALNVGIVA
jgi:hypothetical protein